MFKMYNLSIVSLLLILLPGCKEEQTTTWMDKVPSDIALQLAAARATGILACEDINPFYISLHDCSGYILLVKDKDGIKHLMAIHKEQWELLPPIGNLSMLEYMKAIVHFPSGAALPVGNGRVVLSFKEGSAVWLYNHNDNWHVVPDDTSY